MSSTECGGIVTTQRVTLSEQPIQILSASDRRTRVTLRANGTNTAVVYITTAQGIGWQQGMPLGINEAYEFTDRGARVTLYAVCPGAPGQQLHIITESA